MMITIVAQNYLPELFQKFHLGHSDFRATERFLVGWFQKRFFEEEEQAAQEPR